MGGRDALWDRVQTAWAVLAKRPRHLDVAPGRPRETPIAPLGDEPALAAEGFAEEALPWLNAVHHFSLRLAQGNQDAADDLTQDTFLRAHRFWHTFQRGSNCKSWLFTICRNTYLHERERIRNQRERPASDLDARVEDLSAASALPNAAPGASPDDFDDLIDDEVVQAIDGLSDDFREVLVLSDVGDLSYEEIAEVLTIPIGTVKSRLFRARRLLQDQLRDFAVRSGYVHEDTQP